MKKAYIPDNYEQEQKIMAIESGAHDLELNGLKNERETLFSVIAGLNAEILILQSEATELKAKIAELESGTPAENIILDGKWTSRTVTGTTDVLRLQPPFELPSGVSHFFNNSGRPAYAFQKIEGDVLHAEVIQQDPNVSAVTRAQLTFEFNQEQGSREVYHLKNNMMLSPDFAELEKFTKAISWFHLMEWRNIPNPALGSGGTSCRWLLSIHKDATGKLYWNLKGEYEQHATKPWSDIWKVSNKEMPVILGKEFELKTYFKKGEGAEGHFLVTINGQVLFDVRRSTIYPGNPQLWTKQIQVQKLYIDNEVKDWMRARSKKMWCKYFDLKWLQS